MNLLASQVILVRPVCEIIWHSLAQQSQPLQTLRLFRIDATTWVLFGLTFLCLVLIVLAFIFWNRDVAGRRENERRMIEILESIDRRLAEQERKGDR